MIYDNLIILNKVVLLGYIDKRETTFFLDQTIEWLLNDNKSDNTSYIKCKITNSSSNFTQIDINLPTAGKGNTSLFKLFHLMGGGGNQYTF